MVTSCLLFQHVGRCWLLLTITPQTGSGFIIMAGHTPRPHPAQARSMAQYLINIYSIKVYFPNWNTLGSDVTHAESRVYYDTRIVATNKANICLFSPRCVSPRLRYIPATCCWRRKVSYEHSRGLFNCGLIVLRKEERVESL